jgi:RNA-directed DNA polymerase
VSFRQIEACGLQAWRVSLREEVASKRYRLDAVRRATISKGAGDESLLGIPTIRDRIVPTAVKLVLELIVEADFEDYANGYRPACGAVDAVKEVHRPICQGYSDVGDADLSKYIDPIRSDDVIKSVARRIADSITRTTDGTWG